jgi:hypothetical protein
MKMHLYDSYGNFIGTFDNFYDLCVPRKWKMLDVQAAFNNGIACLKGYTILDMETRLGKFEDSLKQLCILARTVDGASSVIKQASKQLNELKLSNKGAKLKW